jgi:hypothetical protein
VPDPIAPPPARPVDVLRKHLRVNGLGHAADQPLVDAIAGAFAELHPEVLLLREMTALRLEPGDVLVLTTEGTITDEQADDLGTRMRAAFPDNKIALVEGMKLAVVRSARQESPA